MVVLVLLAVVLLLSSLRRELAVRREVSAGECAAKRPPDVRGTRRDGIVAALGGVGAHFDMFGMVIGSARSLFILRALGTSRALGARL